jgi:pyruvate formate lyase activating enzyme
MISSALKGTGPKKECILCGARSEVTSKALNICPRCLRETPDAATPHISEAHRKTRARFNLPPHSPKTRNGVSCNICANECRIGAEETSYCGLKRNVHGKLESLTNPKVGILYSYVDKQVTNCCASWFCPAGTGAGHPRYAYKPSPEYGYSNLAIFFYGCNFNCLFCQNASHKNVLTGGVVAAKDLVEKTRKNRHISCWCFFGGSPEPQLPFAINASKTARKNMPNRLLRICFEWNGCGNPHLVRKAAELALLSGGNLKFDLKCYTPLLSYALSGISNKRAYDNFKMIAQDFYPQRPDLPVLTASTLLVPGYVDKIEVVQIAKFIADVNREISYSLLVFHPDFMMTDLPATPRKQVVDCYKAAKEHLTRVHVGNLNTLGIRDMNTFRKRVQASN